MSIVKADALKIHDRFAGTKIAGSNAPKLPTPPVRDVSAPIGSIANYQKQENAPLELLIFKVVEYLRSLDGAPATPAMLAQKTGGNIYDNPDLLEALKDNPKVTVDDSNPSELRFLFKPFFQIRNMYELIDFINSQKDGVERFKLEDSYKAVKQDLIALKNQGKIYEILNKDKKTYVIFPNVERPGAIKVSDHLRLLWKKLHVPPDDDLQKEMYNLGMKDTLEKESNDNYKKRVPKQKGAPKGSRKKQRIYNTHIGIDLTAPSKGLEARPT